MIIDLEREQIAAAVAPFISSQNPQDLVYAPLKGGSKASLYRFDYNQKTYVLRMLPPLTPECRRRHQIGLATQAGAIGVGPKVLYVDADMQSFVMEFIEGREAEADDFTNPAAFAKFLHTLHHSQAPFPMAMTPFQRFNEFMEMGRFRNMQLPHRMSDVEEIMQELELTLFTEDLLPCHLDLHGQNILCTGQKFMLVDWVNGGLSDPYNDLTTFATFMQLDKVQIETFLTAYFMRPPTEQEWHRFKAVQPIRLFVIATAMLTLSADVDHTFSYEEALQNSLLPPLKDFGKGKPEWSQWQFGLTLYKTALDLVDDEAFKRALKALR
jgi:thiamine kinase